MIMGTCLLLSVLFLAYSNGANDNFKGVATLFGSGTTDYKRALLWATVTTLAGSLYAVYISGNLIASFSGKGLVAQEITKSTSFIIAVGVGAALTVYIATITGFPISTTHALTGALVGAGIASGGAIHFSKLWGTFCYPLFLSPVLSLILTVLIYPLFKLVRVKSGITQETCICINGNEEIVQVSPSGAAVLQTTGLTLTVDELKACKVKYNGSFAGVSAQELLNGLHYFTAGAVSFARGLNDTPKIVALLISASLLGSKALLIIAGMVIAVGGLLNARKVAQTMSKKITLMNHGQGFTANLITALLVIFASKLGLPVSTTHVSCGSLFGIGLVNRKADWNVIGKILASWVVTLPAAAIFAGIIHKAIS